jgi:hypothetical protein
MSATYPRRRSDIMIQSLGDELLLCSPEAKAIHILNPTAQRIWELCDGVHSVEDMEQVLRTSFAVSTECDVAGDINRTVEVFGSKGLLKA